MHVQNEQERVQARSALVQQSFTYVAANAFTCLQGTRAEIQTENKWYPKLDGPDIGLTQRGMDERMHARSMCRLCREQQRCETQEPRNPRTL